jgi:hypothetical protein
LTATKAPKIAAAVRIKHQAFNRLRLAPARAETRVVLAIGNDHYANLPVHE